MNDLVSQLLANSFSAFSPALNTAAAVCKVNGQIAECPEFVNFFGPVMPFLILGVVLISIMGVWKIFVKAGKPGWASIIPIYNLVVMLEIVRKPTWWFILAFIPVVNVVIGFIVAYELSKVFGKGGAFALGLIMLPFIFYPKLGFGDAVYAPANPI